MSASVLVGFFEAEINGAPRMGQMPILGSAKALQINNINRLELSIPRANPIFWSSERSNLNLDRKITR